MNRILALIAIIALGLWLGGLGALFSFATALFAHDRAVASPAVPVLFRTFAWYHLIAAAVALVVLFIWRMRRPSRAVLVALVGVGLATACAIAGTLVLGKMEQVRRDDPHANMMEQPTFRKLHITSNILYAIETLAVLTALGALAGRRETPAVQREVPAEMALAGD